MRTLEFRNDLQGEVIRFILKAISDGYKKFSMVIAVDGDTRPEPFVYNVAGGEILNKLEHTSDDVTGIIHAER